MPNSVNSPLSRTQVVDAYFIEHRARILDLAAFLDRVDRAHAEAPGAHDDFRMESFRRALAVLAESKPDRARRVLELLSDPSQEPIAHAHTKGATGAHNPKGNG